MKKIMYILILLLIPFKVGASTILSSENNKPTVGSIIDVGVDIDYGNAKIASSHYKIKYDNECISLSNLTWGQSQGVYTLNDEGILIDKENTSAAWSKGRVLTLSFRVNKVCTATIDIKENGDTYNDKGEYLKQSFGPLTISSVAVDKNTQVNSISIVDHSFTSTFSKKVNRYSVNVDSNVTSVQLIVKAINNKQVITSNGDVTKDKNDDTKYTIDYELKYGTNKINVNVKAQSGAINTYVILVEREAEEEDISLKRLSVSNTNISLVDYKDTYEARVPTSVDSVLITAVANDPNVTLTGTGNKKLIDGLNEFKIKVSSSSGKEKVYTIKIRRTDDNTEVVGNSKIKTLKINGNYVKEITSRYLMGVSDEVVSLNIEVGLESETAIYRIEGNNLKEGYNKVIITVSDENVDSSIYNIYVYKKEYGLLKLDTFDGLKAVKTPILYTVKYKEDNKITAEIVNKFSKEDKPLYYQVLNDNNGVLYELVIDNKIEKIDDIETDIKKVAGDNLVYSSKIREGITILLYLDSDEFSDGETIRIYSYEEEGNYTLVSDGVVVDNGYVKFTTNGEHNYIFTKNSLIKEEDSRLNLLNQYKDYVVYGIVALVVIILILMVFKAGKKKKLAKNSN